MQKICSLPDQPENPYFYTSRVGGFLKHMEFFFIFDGQAPPAPDPKCNKNRKKCKKSPPPRPRPRKPMILYESSWWMLVVAVGPGESLAICLTNGAPRELSFVITVGSNLKIPPFFQGDPGDLNFASDLRCHGARVTKTKTV